MNQTGPSPHQSWKWQKCAELFSSVELWPRFPSSSLQTFLMVTSFLAFIYIHEYLRVRLCLPPDHQLFRAWFLAHSTRDYTEHVEECFLRGRCCRKCLSSELKSWLVPILLPALPANTWGLTGSTTSPCIWIPHPSPILGFFPSWLFLCWPFFFVVLSLLIAVKRPC